MHRLQMQKMAALVSGMVWLHFSTVAGSGDLSSIFISSKWFKLFLLFGHEIKKILDLNCLRETRQLSGV